MWTPERSQKGKKKEKKLKAFDEVGWSRDCLYISNTEFGTLMESMGTAYFEEATEGQ